MIQALIAVIVMALSISSLRAQTMPQGEPLSKSDILALAALFNDNLLTGGQVAPRVHKWVNEQVAIFLQFDQPNAAEATRLRYIGIALKGVFCAEAQPDKAFTHFHRYEAQHYRDGHGRHPGDQGYWLLAVATDEFEVAGRQVTPGVNYNFFPTPPPSCGADVPRVDFNPPGAKKLTTEEIVQLTALFNDNPLTGGQVPPRFHKWVNHKVSIFLQFDRAKVTEATTLRDIGIAVNGEFCKSKQPHADFPHFHTFHAPTYAEGHGRTPGDLGTWLLWVATDEFDLHGRLVKPGVDREFARLQIPEC